MKLCYVIRCVDGSERCSSWCAPADGVPFSANVLRPAASPFISLRKAPRQRQRWAVRRLIERNIGSACHFFAVLWHSHG